MSGKPFDVVIAGGGLVGASLALALRGYHGRVALIDRPAPAHAPAPLEVRSTALAYASVQLLGALGVWERLQGRAAPIERVHVSDRGHFGAARLEAAELGVPALGYVVENHALQASLNAGLEGVANLTVLAGEVSGATPGEQVVEIALGEGAAPLTARLLVVAAGARAALAQALGLRSSERRYRQSAVVANVRAARPRAGEAFERFTDGGPLALLPLVDGRYAVVMTVAEEQAEALAALPDGAFLEHLQAAFGDRLGEFIEVGPRGCFPLALSQARQRPERRTLLIGNAARALHPVAGQGFNLALRDVAELAALVAGASPGADPGAADGLQRFLRRRRGDQRRTVCLTDSLVHLFSNRFPPLVAARGVGLVAMDLLPPLRRAFARRGMGLGNAYPRAVLPQ